LFQPKTNFSIPIATALALLCGTAAAQSTSSSKALKPDLHAGGFNPSEIVNHEATDVVLPGLHFTGAHVETQQKLCQVMSYVVVSDREIHMKLKGNRAVDDDEWQCTVTIRNAAGSASSWIAVKWTESEEKEHDAHEQDKDKAKAQAFVHRTGKSWRISFAGGPAVTYNNVPPELGQIPEFLSSSGSRIQVAITDDNKVTIIQPGCFRYGTVVGNEVKNGESSGNCTPPGKWTGSVTQ
jgi:hypothetical protein